MTGSPVSQQKCKRDNDDRIQRVAHSFLFWFMMQQVLHQDLSLPFFFFYYITEQFSVKECLPRDIRSWFFSPKRAYSCSLSSRRLTDVCSAVNDQIWTLLTTGDRHQQTHALAYKQTREVDCERGKTEELNTRDCLQLLQLQPTPSTDTHPHSPTRQMHLPAKIRPDRENTFPEISVTYICEQTPLRSTHTHIHAVYFSRWFLTLRCPSSIASVFSRLQT